MTGTSVCWQLMPGLKRISRPSSVESDEELTHESGSFGTLRVALVAHLPAALAMHGCDAEIVMRRAGIPPELFADGRNKIAYQAVGRLIEESMRATGIAHFGLVTGELFDPLVALGQVVDLMQHSPTIGAALRAFILHHHLNDSGAVPMLIPVSERHISLAYVIFGQGMPGIDAFYDAALAYGMKIMRMIGGESWKPLRVTLAHRAPTDPAPYRALFGSQLEFDAPVSAITFPSDLLARPVANADPARYVRLREEMRQRDLRNSVLLADQVRRAFVPMILSGTATAPRIADLFSLSDRVMRKRLASEGTSVRQLLLQARLELAAQLLRGTDLSVSEISATVGYGAPPSFLRAFSGYFGRATPGEWRKHGQGLASPR